MDIFNPQLVDREPTERLGGTMDCGTEVYAYIRARGDIRRHMPVSVAPDGSACETETLAPFMAVAGYPIPDRHFGWVLVKGNSRVDPAAKRKLDAEAARRLRARH